MKVEGKIKTMLDEYETFCTSNRERERMLAAAVLNEIDVEYGVVSARIEQDRVRLQDLATLRNVTAKRFSEDVQDEPAPARRVVAALPVGDEPPRDKALAYAKPADRILTLLGQHGPLTTRQLEGLTDLKVPTLHAALNRLSRQEFRIETFTLQRNESGKLHPHWRLRKNAAPDRKAAK